MQVKTRVKTQVIQVNAGNEWESRDTRSIFKMGQGFALRYIFAEALNELN